MAAMLTALVILGAQLMQPRDPVDETIELARDAAERDDGVAAVKYLELAMRRGKVDFDDAALERVAVAAEEIGDALASSGDGVGALDSRLVAHDCYITLGDRAAALRVSRLPGPESP